MDNFSRMLSDAVHLNLRRPLQTKLSLDPIREMPWKKVYFPLHIFARALSVRKDNSNFDVILGMINDLAYKREEYIDNI